MPSDEPLNWFVSSFNHAYPDWESRGKTQLENKDVEYSWTTAYWAKCGPRSAENEVYFAINQEWWDEHNVAERIGLLIHEFAHYRHTDGHSPQFYKLMAQLYNEIEDSKQELESEIGVSFDMRDVGIWLVKDIEQHQVDTRKHTVYQARMKFAERVGLDIDEEIAIQGVSTTRSSKTLGKTKHVGLDKINFETKDMEEVSEWLRNPRKNHAGVADNSSDYVIMPVPVKENGSGYDPQTEDAEFALSLLAHKNYNQAVVAL